MEIIFLMGLLTVMLTYGMLRLLQRLDTEPASCGRSGLLVQCCLCVLGCEEVCIFWMQWKGVLAVSGESLAGVLLLSVVAACLTAACVMDAESCLIYDYVWLPGGCAAILFWSMGTERIVIELVLYALLQEIIFCRMYGRADCHAFVVCAVLLASLGVTLRGYLLHMLLAFTLLAIVQGGRRNIGRNGNLRKPVAFLPYITTAFWGILIASAHFS